MRVNTTVGAQKMFGLLGVDPLYYGGGVVSALLSQSAEADCLSWRGSRRKQLLTHCGPLLAVSDN